MYLTLIIVEKKLLSAFKIKSSSHSIQLDLRLSNIYFNMKHISEHY